MVRLVIVSGVTLVRVGVSAAVAAESDLTLVACTASEAHAHDLCAGGAEVDVVLVESYQAGGDPLPLAARLREAGARPGVVLLGPHDHRRVLSAMAAGISGYLPLNAPVEMLLATIRRAAAAPGSFTAPDLASVLRDRQAQRQELSPREGEVLQHLRTGSSMSTIARTLLVSESTIKTYTSRIYDKLGVRGRAQAVEVATRSGLLRSSAASTVDL
jgi:DNA-binding NarL/FixJ family response regulator